MIKIKTKEQIISMKEAGKIAYQTLELLNDKIKVGITTKELNDIAYNYIIKNNAIPSFLNYEGYPASICTSVNEEVVHGIPGNRKLKDGDVISVDIGVYKNGVHADTARTYLVGNVSKEVKKLVENTHKALMEGIKVVKSGIKLNKVCEAIEKVSIENNYGVMRELTGHGVGEDLHEDPYIPNYKNEDSEVLLESGMTLAIEPMFALGSKDIYILEDGWTIVTEDNNVASHAEHTILVTDEGYEILTGE